VDTNFWIFEKIFPAVISGRGRRMRVQNPPQASMPGFERGPRAADLSSHGGYTFPFHNGFDQPPQDGGRQMGFAEDGSRPGIEDVLAVRAAIVHDRSALTAVNAPSFELAAVWAAESLRMQQLHQSLVTGCLVPDINGRQIHAGFSFAGDGLLKGEM
jgi:hypothetical protein